MGNEVPHQLLVAKEKWIHPGAPQSLQMPHSLPRRPAPLGAAGRALRPACTLPGVAFTYRGSFTRCRRGRSLPLWLRLPRLPSAAWSLF